jgi:proline iminopeptidase
MLHTRMRRIALGAAVGAAGLLVVYLKLVRPQTMRWGATKRRSPDPCPATASSPGPGSAPPGAITIRARPEQIWPWLLQIGSGRAGWYAFDRIDNAGVPSTPAVDRDLV